ncbi:MAG: HD-GYP domain-containing protein [Thermoleophilia bacterium]|nr:HD-GYP domain-containing protein [Thermoleophilia bacterium]
MPYHAVSIAVILTAVAKLAQDGYSMRTLIMLGGAVVLIYAGLGMRVQDVRRNSGGASQSMHAAVGILVLYLVGPWLAVVGGTIASVAYDLHRHRSWSRLIGNLPTRIVPIAVAGWVWSLAGGGAIAHMSLPADYLPLLLSVAAFALVNEGSFLWDAMSATDLARARWRDEIERLPANLFVTVLESLVGAGVAAISIDNPWAAPVVVPLAASMYVALERGNRIQQVTDSALDTFATIVDERDRYTFEHSDRVCEYAVRIGRRLKFTERQLEALYWTSRLHDLGKVAVDNAILNKPGSLDAAEFDVMRAHPEVSARILASFSFGDYDADVVRCHHERFDGRGYLGRAAEDVPLEAFVIAVADAFDAMTSDRPYREALPHEVALEEIALGVGSQFHPEPALAFLAEMGFDLESQLEALQTSLDDDGASSSGRLGSRRPRTPIELGDDFRDVA